jgi:hypothetical protein
MCVNLRVDIEICEIEKGIIVKKGGGGEEDSQNFTVVVRPYIQYK